MDIDIFRMTAARQIEPDAGAEVILKRRQNRTAATRPAWMPRWVFGALSMAVAMVVGVLGGRPNSNP